MVRRALGLIFIAAGLSLAVVACAGTGAAGAPPAAKANARRPSTVAATPAEIAEQVRRAARLGPGWLDYCPTHPGRSLALYDADTPGGGMAEGWCRTSFVRRDLGDYIRFDAHWHGAVPSAPSGTVTFVYLVPRGSTPTATPVPLLVRQSGQLPP